MVDYVDNILELGCWVDGWADVVWMNILKEINDGTSSIKARVGGSNKTVGYFSGCSIVLMVSYLHLILIFNLIL